MGMFDSVAFFCPKCEEAIIEQSKAGKCQLNKYHQTNVPAEIAADLKGTKVICPVCDITYSVAGEIPRVALRLVDKDNGDGYD